MSRIFYDHLIAFEEIKIKIDSISTNREEKEELWQLVDEMVHHRVVDLILSKLPESHHQEFLEKLYSAPHSEELISYINQKIDGDIETFIGEESKLLSVELLKLLGEKKKR